MPVVAAAVSARNAANCSSVIASASLADGCAIVEVSCSLMISRNEIACERDIIENTVCLCLFASTPPGLASWSVRGTALFFLPQYDYIQALRYKRPRNVLRCLCSTTSIASAGPHTISNYCGHAASLLQILAEMPACPLELECVDRRGSLGQRDVFDKSIRSIK